MESPNPPPAHQHPAGYPAMQHPGTPPVQYPAMQHPGTPIATQPAGGWMKAIAWPEKLGFAALVLSFVIRVESYKTVNGEILHYSNPPATIGGIVAILCGLFALLFLGSTVPNGKSKRLIATVLLFGLGGYQLAAGQGVFAKGKSENSSHIGVGSAVEIHREMNERARRDKVYRSEVAQTQMEKCAEHDTSACEQARAATTQPCNFLPSVCGTLGFLFLEGMGGPVDQVRGLALTEQGCTGQDLNSCANLGILHRDGSGVPQDKKKAASIFETSCERGFGKACHLLGLLRREADNQVGAREAFVDACEAKTVFAIGCRFAFDYVSEGVGGPKDVSASLKWGEIACSEGIAVSCNNMGFILDHGVEIPKDTARAQEYFRLACKGGDGLGCTNYGSLLAKEALPIRALEAYRRGCTLDFGEACFHEAMMLSDKNFAKADSALAAKAAVKACKLDFEKACTLATPPQ